MSFDPGVVLTLINLCEKVYNYAADVKHSSKERRRLLNEVQSLQSQLEALQKLVEKPDIAGDEASMGQLARILDPTKPFDQAVKATLDAVGVALGCRTSDSKPSKLRLLWWQFVAALWWTVHKAEVKQLLPDLERYKSQIGLALQHDIFKKQDIMDGKLDNMKEKLGNKDRLDIAKFISKSDYTGPHRGLIAQRLSGTATWVLEHGTFVAWRDDRESSSTIWCHGNPGVGKSVLAALVVDHLQSSGDVVLSVFCRYFFTATTTSPASTITPPDSTIEPPDFTSPFPVLCGLLRQLIEKTTKVPRAICDLYWRKTDPSPDDLPVFLAEMAASHVRPIYIVIDALDECRIALDLLRAIQQLGPLFRILITSRPVFEEIEQYPSIQIRASDHDILVAIDTTLPKLKGAWLDDALKSMIRAKIVEKADGMFLLASLQLCELERNVTRQRDVLDILDSLPRTLDDAYKLTFQRIREQGERKIELTCRALALVALPSDYLDFEDIQHLLAEGDETQYTDLETVLQCCHGLVCGMTYLEFIHYSVHEYITTHWSELFPDNPNQSDIWLGLGYSALIHPANLKSGLNLSCWNIAVRAMKKPEDFEQVISLLATPAVTTALVAYDPTLAPFIHDPLLIACYCGYVGVMKYMIQTVPPDVQRFNEALRICRSHERWICVESIKDRPDVQVNSDREVVAVDLHKGCKGNF